MTTGLRGISGATGCPKNPQAISLGAVGGLKIPNFTLTTGADTGPDFTGTDADDVFNADFGPGLGGALTQQTLQGFDTLDGGEGNDTLNAELGGIDSLGGSYNPRISNIEQYNLTANNDGYLDLHRSSGYEEIWNKGSRADMTLDNLGEVATLGMDGVRDGAEFEVNYDNIAVETQKVVVNKSGAEGERVELEINGVLNGDITNLDLNVSNGVHLRLDNDAADIDNLTIAGDGILDLVGEDQFEFLQTLDTLGYDGDVTLDISGSGSLTSVLTGDGSDTITAAAANFSADTPPTTLDLGAGENRLILEDTFETQPEGTYTGGGLIDSAELSALNFTLAPVSNVQTLTLADVDLDGDASLALEGVGGLETLEFQDFANDVGDDLLINGTPETLTINGTSASSSADDAEFDMNGGQLTVNDAVNLTMNAGGDLFVDGGLQGDKLETLVMNAGDNVELSASEGLDALTSIEVNALGTAPTLGWGGSDADVDLTLAGALGDPSELGALTTVNVTADDDVNLTMTGRAGSAAVAGVRQVEQFVVNVGDFGLQAGEIIFASGDLTGGAIVTNYSEYGSPFTSSDNGAARDVAADLNGSPDLTATSPTFRGIPSGNTVTVEWADFGVKEQLNVLSAVRTDGTITGPTTGLTTLVTAGVTPEAMVAGNGFEALQTITVDAGEDADVELTDVYGAFSLDVTAVDNAWIDLYNTEVTSVIAKANHVDIDVAGDTVGNSALTTISVSSTTANITLEDNLKSFSTLDVVGVATNLIADTSGADFGALATGDFITYTIGATSDGIDGTTDVDFTGNAAAREVYDFAGGDIGEVEITGFTWGADPATGDRLDLSDFASNAGELVFSDVGTDLVITDLNGGFGEFGGSITILGAAGQGFELGQFNILYA